MDPTNLLGKSVMDVLEFQRNRGGVFEYSQIEGDEFLKFPESGFYLHAKGGGGIINDCRIYFESRDGYFPAKISTRGMFGNLETIEDFKMKFGEPVKEVRSIKIPGAEPTLPGKIFEDSSFKITAYSKDSSSVTYIHVKRLDIA